MRKQDYIQCATAALKDFEDRGIPLIQSVKQAVDERELNNDQARRLVEFTNTMAHLNMFNAKEAADKYIEFDIVDPASVVCAAPIELDGLKTAAAMDNSDFYLDLPDMRTSREKVASEGLLETQIALTATSPSTDPYAGTRLGDTALRLHKTAEALRLEVLGAYSSYLEGVEKLADMLARTNVPQREIDIKDARALHKEAADVILADVAALNPRLGVEHVKTASTWIFASAFTDAMTKVASARERAVEAGRGYKYLQERLGA